MDNIKRSVTYDYYPLINDDKGTYQNISIPKQPVLADCTDLYQKFINGFKLSEKQKLELFNNLISNVFTNTEKLIMANQVYKSLLNKGNKHTNAEMIFLTQFTVFQSYRMTKVLKYGPHNPMYEDYVLPELRIRYDVPKETRFAAFQEEPGIIEVNYENFMAHYISRPFDRKSQFLIDYLHVICHEMTHNRQMYEAFHGFMTKSAFDYICRQYFYYENFDSETNYRYRQIEIEAELDGMRQTIEISRSYTPELQKETEMIVKDSEQILLETASSIQYASINGLFYLTDEYDVRGIIQVVKNKPQSLQRFPQLTHLFDVNTGELVSEERLLSIYQSCKGAPIKADLIYEQFLIYKYCNLDSMKDLRNTNLPPDLLELKTEFIKEQLYKECDYCKKIMRLLNSPRLLRVNQEFMKNQAPNILDMRRKRIFLYMEYLKRVKVDQSLIDLSNEILKMFDEAYKEYFQEYVDLNKVNDKIDDEFIGSNDQGGIKKR